jgi:hypothetical protein
MHGWQQCCIELNYQRIIQDSISISQDCRFISYPNSWVLVHAVFINLRFSWWWRFVLSFLCVTWLEIKKKCFQLNVLKCTVTHSILLVAHFKAWPLFMLSHFMWTGGDIRCLWSNFKWDMPNTFLAACYHSCKESLFISAD